MAARSCSSREGRSEERQEETVSHVDRAHVSRQACLLAVVHVQLHLLQGPPPITRRQMDAASRLLTRRELCDVINERAAAGLCGSPQCTRTVDVTLRQIFNVVSSSSKFYSEGCEERCKVVILCFPWEQGGGEGRGGGCWSRDELTAVVTAVTTADADAAGAGSGDAATGEAGSAASGSAGVSEKSGSGTGGEGRAHAGEVEASALVSSRLQSAAARLWAASMAGVSGVAGEEGSGGAAVTGGFLGLVLMAGGGGEPGAEGMEEDGDGHGDGDGDGDGEEWRSEKVETLRGARGTREGRRRPWGAGSHDAPLVGSAAAAACVLERGIAGEGSKRACSGATAALRDNIAGCRGRSIAAGRSSGGDTRRTGIEAGSGRVCVAGQGAGLCSGEVSTCRRSVSAAFWEALLCERGEERRNGSSTCVGGHGDAPPGCVVALGDEACSERGGTGEEEEELEHDEMPEQAAGRAEGEAVGGDVGRLGGINEALGVEAVWHKLMVKRLHKAASKSKVLLEGLPSATSHSRMPLAPFSPPACLPSSPSTPSSRLHYPPQRSASLPLASSFSSPSRSSPSRSSSSRSSPSRSSPSRSSPSRSSSSRSSPSASFCVPSPPPHSRFSAFKQATIPTTPSRFSSAQSADPVLSSASSPLTRPRRLSLSEACSREGGLHSGARAAVNSSPAPAMPCAAAALAAAGGPAAASAGSDAAMSSTTPHALHPRSAAPHSLTPRFPSPRGVLRPALRTSPRYTQGSRGEEWALRRSVLWADAQGRALVEELESVGRA
ncbi:hypothetical protein CLOM_g20869 [Closterium sp. NIES-68]|nr:hypothetical protein CLOM_g20869 [Closterium sp. NIES-68]GJP68511.1 hypothetical protein CLOP_g25207 [Closterium sp. NIES-67]